MEVAIGAIYRHFKGNLYKVICLAEDSETGKELVIYQALYGENKIYARPKDMFLSPVDKNKYPDATQNERFKEWDGGVNGVSMVQAPQTPQKPSGNEASFEKDAGASFKRDEADFEASFVSGKNFNENPAGVDSRVMDFLDTKSFEEKLNILTSMKSYVTDDMLNTMAFSMDLELNPGTTEDKYQELLNAVTLREKFECNRLR